MKENLQLKTKVRIANPVEVSRYEEVDLIIDTGATFSMIKKERLQRLGVPPIGKRKLKLANGEIVEGDVGVAWFTIDNKGEGGSDVIFGEENDVEVLGLVTLENMALTIDTKTGELKPVEVFLLKGGIKMAELSGKKILLIIASKDFRDEEYFEPKRILESAGATVVTASSKLGDIKGMFGKKTKVDMLIDDVKVGDYDAIVLCGGIGASEYYQNKKVHSIFSEADRLNKIIAAICISPVTLANAGVLKNKKATVFYSEKPLLVSQGAIYVDVPVVRDGNVITGRDPGAAVEFGETLKKALLER